MSRRRNETEEGERSLRSQSPVLGCLLWVTLLEQGLGQGDLQGSLSALPVPRLFLVLVSSFLLQGTACCRLCGKLCAAELFSEYVVTGFNNTAVRCFLSLRKSMGLVLNVKT